MSKYIITIDQIKDLVMQSSAEAIDAYRLGAVKWNWQYPLLPKIVRCKDCDYYDHWDACGRYREKHVCMHWDCLEIEPDGFCAWGERKEQ